MDPVLLNTSKIQLLSEELINQIAAGEVIERPANVVKELIENALDASATQIRIDVDNGGKSLIKISDNGSGMSRADVKMALKRHATSKIASVADLFKIHSLGFRGEALASIASVSRLTIQSKPQGSGDAPGVEVQAESEKIISEKDYVMNPGTTMIVQDLFYSIPVRQKFLKSDLTELGHISDWLQKFILAYPQVGFALNHAGRQILHSPGYEVEGLQNAIANVFGPGVAKKLLNVSLRTERMKIEGFMADPTETRSDRNAQLVFLNGRYIYNATIHKAIAESFNTYIPTHRHGIAILKIECHPAWVDVNVHPTKKEVRFQDGAEIYAFVKSALRQTLLTAGAKRFEILGQPDVPVEFLNRPNFSMPAVNFSESSASSAPVTYFQSTLIEASPKNKYEPEPVTFQILGQIYQTYILMLYQNQFLIVDQHVAQERVIFDGLISTLPTQVTSQQLLLPEILNLAPSEEAVLQQNLAHLQQLGFGVEALGTRRYRLTAVPQLIINPVYGKTITVESLVRDILAELAQTGDNNKAQEVQENILKTVACKASIKAGMSLQMLEMQALVADLLKTQNPYTCPHGRPIIIPVDEQELGKRFKRI
jgi:DNA mismatch repair protein MutL